MNTKVLILAIALALLYGARASAQQIDLIPFHYTGYDRCVNKVLQRPDGDIVSIVPYVNVTNDSLYDFLGNVFYRVSPTSVAITDTLFVPGDNDRYCHVLAKDPDGEGYIKVETEQVEGGGTDMHILRFSGDGFPVTPSEEVVVPLCDGQVCGVNGCMLDCRGDLIVRYRIPLPEFLDTLFDFHIARFGLDGTLKYDTLLAYAQTTGPGTDFNNIGFAVFSEQPLKYYFQSAPNNLYLYVYDSLFRQENYYVISQSYDPLNPITKLFLFTSHDKVKMILDGGDIVLATNFYDGSDPNHIECGMAMARYNLRTMQQERLALINDFPGMNSWTQTKLLLKSSSGHLYLVYVELDTNDPSQINTPISVIKMDPDLNILWRRYIEMPKDHYADYAGLAVISEDEEKTMVTVVGSVEYQRVWETGFVHKRGSFYFFLTDDDPLDTDEGEIRIRPYAFWPNPVQDQLRLQYSPDVQPQSVELYDLQGRLVRAQTANFESFGMAGLAAGQYVMKVTLADGKVYSDKVVKE